MAEIAGNSAPTQGTSSVCFVNSEGLCRLWAKGKSPRTESRLDGLRLTGTQLRARRSYCGSSPVCLSAPAARPRRFGAASLAPLRAWKALPANGFEAQASSCFRLSHESAQTRTPSGRAGCELRRGRPPGCRSSGASPSWTSPGEKGRKRWPSVFRTPRGGRKDSKDELQPRAPEPNPAFSYPNATPLSVLRREFGLTRREAGAGAGGRGVRQERSRGLKPVVFAFVSPTNRPRNPRPPCPLSPEPAAGRAAPPHSVRK